MMYYFLARDKNTDCAIGIYKTDDYLMPMARKVLGIIFEEITKAEYETYVEFDMYVIQKSDSIGKLMEMAKKL